MGGGWENKTNGLGRPRVACQAWPELPQRARPEAASGPTTLPVGSGFAAPRPGQGRGRRHRPVGGPETNPVLRAQVWPAVPTDTAAALCAGPLLPLATAEINTIYYNICVVDSIGLRN